MASMTQWRHRMRCRKASCKHRFTLRKSPKGEIDCPICGSPARSVEEERQRELAKQDRCHCYPIPFPHRKGSILGCEHHPTHPDDWDIDQERQYEGMMMTPRSG